MTVPFALDRNALARVLAVANGKGGVGKTSTATHLAAGTAAAGKRVLLIDLDSQNNTAQDLGYVNSDGGRSVVAAVMLGTPLALLKDVRPRLDVVAGGKELLALTDFLKAQRTRENDDNRGSTLAHFAAVIAAHTAGYDLVVLDCPPATNDTTLQDAALSTARYLLVPTHSDKSSREGLREMADRMRHVRGINPDLVLLGVLLFGVGARATVVRQLARGWIEVVLGGAAPVFETTIRHAEAVAFDIREEGRLAFELDPAVPDADPVDDEDGDEVGKRRRLSPAAALGGDYRRMSVEVLRRLVSLENAA